MLQDPDDLRPSGLQGSSRQKNEPWPWLDQIFQSDPRTDLRQRSCTLGRVARNILPRRFLDHFSSLISRE